MKMLVTGGLGFIGSAFIRNVAARHEIQNIDAMTYAADERRISDLDVETIHLDVTDPSLAELISTDSPEIIVHFAAETHVTRSEMDEDRFFRTNVGGTRNILEAARSAGVAVVVHVSTDEVYGPALDHPFTEDEKEPGEGAATSPYARSKAVADDLALTFAGDLRILVVRPTNCFGPWQHPEKAVPRWTTRALSGQRLPVWGDGLYVRDWMFVDDAGRAIELLIDSDAHGVFNIGPENEVIPNLEIATMIAQAAGAPPDAVYLTDYDRPDHDRRYSVDTSKIRSLGWSPEVGVRDGIERTVDWYRAHRDWWEGQVASAEALYADQGERS